MTVGPVLIKQCKSWPRKAADTSSGPQNGVPARIRESQSGRPIGLYQTVLHGLETQFPDVRTSLSALTTNDELSLNEEILFQRVSR